MLVDYWDNILLLCHEWEKFCIYFIGFFFCQVLIVSLKSGDAYMSSYQRQISWLSLIISLPSDVKYFSSLSCCKRSEIFMGGFQSEFMQSKLDAISEEVVVVCLVYRRLRRSRVSYWQTLVIRCLIVVVYFYWHLLVLMEIKIMWNSK